MMLLPRLVSTPHRSYRKNPDRPAVAFRTVHTICPLDSPVSASAGAGTPVSENPHLGQNFCSVRAGVPHRPQKFAIALS
jgi:hypothetical protein